MPTRFPWFGCEWLLAVSRNKVCLNGTKISGYWRHPKRCDDGAESYSTIGVPKNVFQQRQHRWPKCIAAQGEYFEVDPSQYTVSIQVWLQWNHFKNFIAIPRNSPCTENSCSRIIVHCSWIVPNFAWPIGSNGKVIMNNEFGRKSVA
jgi:hypothetical protein